MRNQQLLGPGIELIDEKGYPVWITPREKSVIEEAIKGSTSREIARDLFLSEKTIKAHLGTIFAKLGCHSRVRVVMLYASVVHGFELDRPLLEAQQLPLGELATA